MQCLELILAVINSAQNSINMTVMIDSVYQRDGIHNIWPVAFVSRTFDLGFFKLYNKK